MNFFRYILSRRRIFMILIVVLPIVARTFSYQVLPKEGSPEISAPHAIVITPYPGASPGEIKSLVTNPVEEALSDLKNVEEMRSSSAEGVSVVVVDFDVEADLERSLQKAREKVTDTRHELPDDIEEPSVKEISFTDIDFDYIYITVETPRGTDVDNTDGIVRRIEGIVKEIMVRIRGMVDVKDDVSDAPLNCA